MVGLSAAITSDEAALPTLTLLMPAIKYLRGVRARGVRFQRPPCALRAPAIRLWRDVRQRSTFSTTHRHLLADCESHVSPPLLSQATSTFLASAPARVTADGKV